YAGRQPLLVRGLDGEERRVPPDRRRAGGDPRMAQLAALALAVVDRLERPEAARARADGDRLLLGVAVAATKGDGGHLFSLVSLDIHPDPQARPGLAPCRWGRLPRLLRAGSLSLSRCGAGRARSSRRVYGERAVGTSPIAMTDDELEDLEERVDEQEERAEEARKRAGESAAEERVDVPDQDS